jgi:ABC-2 type transport system ATP-binding protein
VTPTDVAPDEQTPADVAAEDSALADAAPDDEAPAEQASTDAAADPVPADTAVDEVAPTEQASTDAVADPVPADTAAEDPTPADVAIEEPVVADDQAVVADAEPLVYESADDAALTVEALAADPVDTSVDTPVEDPTSADVAVEEPVLVDERDGDPDDGAAVVPHPVEEPSPGPDNALDELLTTETDEPASGDRVDESVDADEEPTAATSTGAAIGAAALDGAPSSTDADEAIPALALRNVTKTFGELRAVDGIDLTIPAGSFYGLVGPNGAGKTTTLSIIAGLLRADAGTVSINGVDAAKNSRAAKKMIGVLPDRLRTFDRLTGRQLLSYYGALRGLPAALVESRSADLARAFDLVDALARPVSDYSAGMTKKVMLAGAMIHSPRLLVLDEPFEAVDPVSSAVILDILGAYVGHGGTVILSSHGMELVERVCSRVAVIVSGQVLAEGTVDEVRGEASLEQRFLELAGGLGDVEGLEWLHTFSG